MTPKLSEQLQTNAIFQEMQRLSPGYEPDFFQARAILAASNPVEVARTLQSQIEDLKEDASRYLAIAGVEARHIQNDEALRGLRRFREVLSASGKDKSQARNLGSLNLVAIGKRVGAVQAIPAQLDFVSRLYLKFLKRLPSQLALYHYRDELDGGRPAWTIVREIELSAEAQALRLAEKA